MLEVESLYSTCALKQECHIIFFCLALFAFTASAMAENSGQPSFKVRLLVDEERNKVVLAEAGGDFVDVFFSLLTLPMGTIVRLLEKHQTSQSVVVGSFNNLYRSVRDLGICNFQSEVLKDILLYPRNAREDQCRRLKLNIDDTEATKYFMCPSFVHQASCCKVYSHFKISRCSCGSLMEKEIQIPEEVKAVGVVGDNEDGVFVSGLTSFIITDDLKVTFNSVGLLLKAVKGQGYKDVDKLGELLLDVGSCEVITLLECLLSSDTPLTDAFLRKQSSHRMRRMHCVQSPAVRENCDAAEEGTITLDVYFRKRDRKILFVDGEDFIDLLLTFLVLPLESVWEMSGSIFIPGCIGMFCRCFKVLDFNRGANVSTSKCVLPCFHGCQTQLLDFVTQQPPTFYRSMYRNNGRAEFRLSRNCEGVGIMPVTSLDAKSEGSTQSTFNNGFVKRGRKFRVSDDLFVTTMSSSPTICLVKKLQMDLDDIDEQVIRISKVEAISLLRATLMTSSALTTAFGNLVAKKPKEETLRLRGWN